MLLEKRNETPSIINACFKTLELYGLEELHPDEEELEFIKKDKKDKKHTREWYYMYHPPLDADSLYNKLFTFIPDYEKVQVEIYLRLTNLKKGKLIQNYNETQSSFDFNQDDKLWNTIITELHTVSMRVLNEIE